MHSSTFTCWSVILNAPLLWNNSAKGNGGAVYGVVDKSLALVCGNVSPGRDAADTVLANFISKVLTNNANDSRASGHNNGGISMGYLPRTSQDTRSLACFAGPHTLSQNSAEGYGQDIATKPKWIVIRTIAESDPPQVLSGNNSNNSACSAANNTWTQRAVLHRVNNTNSSGSRSCWPGQCSMLVPNNVAIDLYVDVYDAIQQLANDTTSLKPVIRASVRSLDSSNITTIFGNPTAQVVESQAALKGLRVWARAGAYQLRLSLETVDLQVEPLTVNFTVPPCALGEISLEQGFLCTRCPSETYTMDIFTDANVSQANVSQCHSCPSNAICPGGAVVVPQSGYWHSAANSTLIHQCPNSGSCRDGDVEATDALVRCQQRWFSYFGEPGRYASLISNDAGGINLVGAYLDAYISASQNCTTASSPLSTENFDGFLLDCALWGTPSDHANSYMQSQCSRPTQPYYVTGFSVRITLLTDYSQDQQWGQPPAVDVLKMMIVHMQYFVIVANLGLGWPSPVEGLQSVLSSLMGNIKQ
ncbi:hypothetical protein TSOC_001131, partial [Tetrabaena socialis]